MADDIALVACSKCGEKWTHTLTKGGVHTHTRQVDMEAMQSYGDLIDVTCSEGHTTLDVLTIPGSDDHMESELLPVGSVIPTGNGSDDDEEMIAA